MSHQLLFNNTPESSRDLTIFKCHSFYHLKLLRLLFQIQGFFLSIAASVADAAAVSPSIPKGFIALFNNGSPDFNNGAKNLKNPPFCVLVNNAFDSLISVDVWSAKALQLVY